MWHSPSSTGQNYHFFCRFNALRAQSLQSGRKVTRLKDKMKNLMKYLLFAGILFLSLQSCKKSEGVKPEEPPVSFINTNSGSKWNYHEVNASQGNHQESDYSITSSSEDTTINGKKYHIYHYSFGGNQYLNQTNQDYYEYADFADLGQSFERLYLKAGAKVNDTWNQEVSVPVPNLPVSVKLKVTNQVMDIGSKSVNGTSYQNVVHVKTTISSSDIPSDKLTTDINSYYAPEYGLIENTTLISIHYFSVDIDVNLKTTLQSATIN